MKKYLLSFILIIGFFGVYFVQTPPVLAQRLVPSYWKYFLEQLLEKYERNDLFEKYTKYFKQPVREWKAPLPRVESQKKAVQKKTIQKQLEVSTPKTSSTPFDSSKRIFNKPVFSSNNQKQNQYRLLLTPRSVTPTRSIETLSEKIIPVFEVGVKNASSYQTNRLPEAVYLKSVDIAILNVSGVAKNLEDFELIVNGEPISFNKEDSVFSIKFKNFRFGKGDAKTFTIGLKVKDPSQTPHLAGSIGFRLQNPIARNENLQKEAIAFFNGTALSGNITFSGNGVAPTANTNIVTVPSGSIQSKMIGAGTSEYVLGMNLRASYDDFLLEKLELNEVLSGKSIDTFAKGISVIDGDSGRTLDTTRFINGTARFNFNPRMRINRNNQKKIFFKIHIAEKFPRKLANTQFRLEVPTDKVQILGVGSGRYLPNSAKNFTINKETFVVVNNIVSAQEGRKININPTQNTRTRTNEIVFQNSGENSSYISRFSFRVFLNQFAFPAGISPDDFEIVRSNGNESPIGHKITISGQNVRVDFDSPVIIAKNEPQNFTIKMKLENTGTINNSNSVSIELLNDTSFLAGNLKTLQNSGANFVWSDGLGFTDEVWRNGFYNPGIFGQTIASYRNR